MTTQPNRRDALKSVAALAGLFAAPAVKAAPAPTMRGFTQEEIDELDSYGPRLTPQQRRLRDEALVVLLAAFWEVEAAMEAVLDDQEEEDERDPEGWFYVDVDGIRFYAGLFAVMHEGEAVPSVTEAAKAELARRREAHERGVYHGCPVLWGRTAIDRAIDGVGALLDQHEAAGCPDYHTIEDARYQLYLLWMLEGAYFAGCSAYLSDAALGAETRRATRGYRGEGLPRPKSKETRRRLGASLGKV